MRRRLTCILLVICLVLGIAACGDEPNKKSQAVTLSAPSNLRIVEQDDMGVVRWDAVENAERYIVTVNGTDNETENTYWNIQPLTIDYTISVVACRKGSKNSPAAMVNFTKREVSVSISGGSECRSGKTLQLEAVVTNTSDNGVTWQITAGDAFAEISSSGLLTADTVSGDKIVTVKATSTYDTSAFATKTITITAKPDLTQIMLDELDESKLSYEGYLDIEQWVYNTDQLVGSVTRSVATTMDGESWFSEHQEINGLTKYSYYEDRDDIAGRQSTACKVSVDFMNNEVVEPIVDADGNYVAWSDVDYKNKLKDLSIDEFEFNEDNWRWEYTGGEGATEQQRKAAIQAITDSVGSFDFVPKSVYLIVDSDLIVGLYIEAEDDFSMYDGYVVRTMLTTSVNIGDSVDVKKIARYEHLDIHDELQGAIDKMHALESYTTESLDYGTAAESGVTYNGYIETVTQDACYMRPFVFTPFQASLIEIGSGVREFSGFDFGYVKCSEDLYNSFNVNNGVYTATRAFEGEFKNAMPSFAFAAEIFTTVKSNADGSKTYYVDAPMTNVATTFYNGLGNEMSVYGIFANSNFRPTAYLPYVTVSEDGYISNAGFCYYLGAYYGEIKLEYRDFNTATIESSVQVKLNELKSSPREIPDGWDDIDLADDGATVNALDYLKGVFGDDIADRLPYFGAAIGDTFYAGETSFRIVNWVGVESINLLFDVPFDNDFSIDTALNKVCKLLEDNGFVKNDSGKYVKGNISVELKDSQKLLYLSVWNNTPSVD